MVLPFYLQTDEAEMRKQRPRDEVALAWEQTVNGKGQECLEPGSPAAWKDTFYCLGCFAFSGS